MKNCEPPVLGPALAIEIVPLSFSSRLVPVNSSFILYPGPPIPVPVGSPPWIINPGIILWNITPS